MIVGVQCEGIKQHVGFNVVYPLFFFGGWDGDLT